MAIATGGFLPRGGVIPLSVLWSNAAGMAGRMSRDHGIGPGDRVLVVLENSSDYVSLLLAIWCLGAVAVPIRPYGGRHLWFDAYLAELARIADYRLIVHEPGTPAFDTAAVVARLGRPCIAVDELRSEATAPVGPVAGNRPDDHAVIQFTSGSTGQPKGVIVTHGMMLEQLEQLRENQRYARRGPGVERALSWLPFFHDMGLFIGVLLPLFEHAHGGAAPTAYYMRNPARWFQHLSDWRADVSFSTSSVLASSLRLLGRLNPAACRLDALHLYVAAEKVSPRVLRSAMAALAPFGMAEEQWHIGYGMAEYALGCTHSPHGAPRTIWIDARVPSRAGGGSGPRCHRAGFGGHPQQPLPDRDPCPGREPPARGPGRRDPPHRALPHPRLPERPGGQPGEAGRRLAAYRRPGPDPPGRAVLPRSPGRADGGRRAQRGAFRHRTAGGGPARGGSRAERAVRRGEPRRPAARSRCSWSRRPTALTATNWNLRESRIRERLVEEAGLVIKRVVFVPRCSIEKTSSGKKRRRIIRQRYLNGELERMEAHVC